MKKVIKLLFCLCFFVNCALAKNVKFIQITDVGLNEKNAYKLYKTIEEINSYKDVDFIVFSGNNLDKPNVQNLNTFLYLLKKVNKKTYVVIGNQDVNASNGIDKNTYMELVSKKVFRHSKKPNYTFKSKDYVFVVMDGTKQYFQTTNGYYSKQELLWLENILNKYKQKNVIILQHFPILKTKSAWLETAKMEDYLDVLSKFDNVKMIVSGHYNQNIEKVENGIINIITESYSKNNSYKIIEYNFEDDFWATYLVK